MANRTLGLDLGPNSIGWCLIDDDPAHPERPQLVAVGVRIFPEGVDQFDTAKEESRNEARRVARGMRRQTNRRARRMRRLRQALVEVGLFPAGTAEQAQVDMLDPYALRAGALDRPLAPHELGRVFLHLAQHRGFLSNRVRDGKDKEVEGMLAEIGELEREIHAAGKRTLGELLYSKALAFDHAQRHPGDKVRRRHTHRAMYEHEFDTIWEAQCRMGHAELLTELLKYGAAGRQKYPCRPSACPAGLSNLAAYGIHGLIFFQRPIYWPRSMVGPCELEPKQRRSPRADRRAQRFRLLQEVNNLRYFDPDTRDELPLSAEQRRLLIDKLSSKERMTFKEIRKALGFLESVEFNLERGKRSSLQGNVVDCQISRAVGDSWIGWSEDEKNNVVTALLDPALDEEDFVMSAGERWGLGPDQAEQLVGLELPAGYANLSVKAMERLLPHMERGLPYQSVSDPEKSALHAAGYLRRDELQRRIFDRLPNFQRCRNSPIGDLPNPVVRRALVEVRKVVNAVVREYGRPDAVHVEMGRDLKTRPKRGSEAYRRYQERLGDMRQREERRKLAAEKLNENNIRVTRESIQRYLLWEDQRGECIYTGRPIAFRQLFSGDTDVDHILPRSQSLDDSQDNKVVCFREANAGKGDRTPHAWLAHGDSGRYEQICQRATSLMRAGKIRYGKFRRLLQKEVKLEDFIARQLNDTRYIARLTAEYLRSLFDADHRVLGLKGQITAELRIEWGLETLLSELPDSPAWHEQAELRPGEKNRADHRHHAVDAIVVALTNRSRLQQLAELRRRGEPAAGGEVLNAPWLSFRDDVKQAIEQIRVSHRAERKVSGRLHEETVYGKTETTDEWVARKAVESLSPNEVERVRDPVIRRLITARLREHGIDVGRGQRVDAKAMKVALANLQMPSGVPIRKVRITKSDKTIRPLYPGRDDAFVKPGATHHLCVFEWGDDKKTVRDVEFVTLLEATRRLLAREPVIQKHHPTHPDARFVMSLSRGEMVQVTKDGREMLLVFVTAASTTKQMQFVEHTDARRAKDVREVSFKPSTFVGAGKVTVDPLGRVRKASD